MWAGITRKSCDDCWLLAAPLNSGDADIGGLEAGAASDASVRRKQKRFDLQTSAGGAGRPSDFNRKYFYFRPGCNPKPEPS